MAYKDGKVYKQIWTSELTLEFIDLFKKHSNLWDRQCPEFGERSSRLHSLSQISIALGVSPGELRMKMQQMRTKFNNYRKRFEKQPVEYEKLGCNWPYYEPMKFLISSYRSFDERRALCASLQKSSSPQTSHVQNAIANRENGLNGSNDLNESNGPNEPKRQRTVCHETETEYMCAIRKNNDHLEILRSRSNTLSTVKTESGRRTSVPSQSPLPSNDSINDFFQALAKTVNENKKQFFGKVNAVDGNARKSPMYISDSDDSAAEP